MNNTNPPKLLFLTKAQRQQLALQHLQEQCANNASDSPASKPSSERQRERDHDSEMRNHEREREHEREEEAKAREQVRLDKLAEREMEKELDAIKEQYLGSKKPKKRGWNGSKGTEEAHNQE
ncbi:hypothetical protein V6N13_064277 [Hibiscus sabdariffa]|uniref:Uncharacterized protein n=1 Tax=Hibiscus sabdariffa TaxID=183260 RepID=A0ABR2E9H0_9ROSI